MMSLETPQMSRKHLLGFLFLSAVSRRLTRRIQEDEADLSQREKTWKNLQKSVDIWPGVWYYTWAPSAETKEWLLKSQQGSWRKEPIDAERFQSVLRNLKRSKFRKFEMLRKKCLTKNHFCDKIIKSSAGRLRCTGPWKLNNIEKLVTEPIFVLEKHVKQFQTK